MDLLTHILYQHYDPSWLFLNEQKIDLTNRLSKQKERNKQLLIDEMDKKSTEERYTMMQKQRMGLSNWHQENSAASDEYTKSEAYADHTEDERRERLNEIQSRSNLELDFLHKIENKDEIEELNPSTINPINEDTGYINPDELDEDAEETMNGMMDEEQEGEYNE